VIGAQVCPYLQPGHWQATSAFREFNTDDEFEGSEIKQNQLNTDTTVHEGIWFLDLQGTYQLSKQTSLTLDVPVMLSSHWSTVIAGTRYNEHAHGLFDISLEGRCWLLDTAKHTNQNISVALGVRLPTGNSDATALFPDSSGKNVTQRPVFIGIQTGSGAWAIPVTVEGFRNFRYFTTFGTGSYLFSLKGQNDTLSFGAALNPAGPGAVAANIRYNSTPDSYLGHVGVAAPLPIPRLGGVSLIFAGRIEGVPVYNVFGPTVGYRQPGYYVTIEPGLNYTTHLATYSLSVPVRVDQNLENSEGHPTASVLAPILVEGGISFNFGGRAKPAVQ
jgi:hypothetical protein